MASAFSPSRDFGEPIRRQERFCSSESEGKKSGSVITRSLCGVAPLVDTTAAGWPRFSKRNEKSAEISLSENQMLIFCWALLFGEFCGMIQNRAGREDSRWAYSKWPEPYDVEYGVLGAVIGGLSFL